jgi:hypothetical protein
VQVAFDLARAKIRLNLGAVTHSFASAFNVVRFENHSRANGFAPETPCYVQLITRRREMEGNGDIGSDKVSIR